MDILSFAKRINPLLWVLCLVLTLTLANGVVLAQGTEQSVPYDEEEAQAIDRMLICPVCPAETIDQAQVQLSKQMRALVRDMLSQGASRDEILDFFVDRYGADVLAAPPKSGVNLLAWILPPVGVLAALLAGLIIIRSMTVGSGAPATDPLAEDGLEPYLDLVDQDLSLPQMPDQEGIRPTPEEETGPDTSRLPGPPDQSGEGGCRI